MRHTKALTRFLVTFTTLIITALLCGSCGGGSPAGDAAGQAGTVPALSMPPLELPVPSELAGLIDAPRRGSYVEEGLIRHGMEYEGGLPSRNVSIVGETASFDPDWSPGSGLGPENLAFCMFSFAAEDFDREPQIRYGWEIAPADGERTYLGLSSWEHDNWEWFLLGPAGYRPFATLDQYISTTGLALAVVVQTGTEVSRLRYIRLGPQQLYAELWAEPARGVGPLEVKLDAHSSYCLAGSIVEVVWDLDGDGSYDVSSGALLEKDHTYDPPGQWQPRVRITSEYGVQATDSAVVSAHSPWGHSWSTALTSQICGIATDGQSAVYAVGDQNVDAGMRDVLLLKYDLGGGIEWARTWGGPANDYGFDVAVSADGGVYVAGHTLSFGPGEQAAVLQRWDSAGNLIWTRTWGEFGFEGGHGIALSGDHVYLAGQTTSFGDLTGDVLLLAFSTDGEYGWARTVGGAAAETCYALEAWQHPVSEVVTLHMAGHCYSIEPSGEAMYVRFNGDGDLIDFETWSASYRSAAMSIALMTGYTDLRVFVGGYIAGVGSEVALLVEVGTGDIVTGSWGSGDNGAIQALAVSNGSIFAGGYTRGLSSTADALLLGYTLDGQFSFSMVWDGDQAPAGIGALAPYPDSGVLVGGFCASLGDGSWKPASGSGDFVSGCWVQQEPLVNVGAPTGIVNEPSQQPVAVTDWIEDTGEGTWGRVLLLAHPGS